VSLCGVCAAAALMFSATFRKRVERVARDILTDPLRVVQGDAGEVTVPFARPVDDVLAVPLVLFVFTHTHTRLTAFCPGLPG